MITGLPSLADINIHYRMIADMSRQFYPLVTYRRLQNTEGDLDDVHLEISDAQKRFSEPLQLRAFVQPSDESVPLTIFGIQRMRDTVLFASVPDLIDVGLASQDPVTKKVKPTCAAGDRFEFGGLTYDVLAVVLGGLFGNTDVPVFYKLESEKLHLDAQYYQNV